MSLKNKTIKFISAFLLILILVPTVLFFRPRQAEAFWWSSWVTDIMTGNTTAQATLSAGANVTSTAVQIKNVALEVIKQVLRTIARKALQQITKSTVNWINSGFHGNPLFIENSDSFFKDIAKYEIKNIIDTYGYNAILYPFGKSFALNTLNSYSRQASDNAAYTLSKVMTDPVLLKSYQNDFNVGGWNGFLINTQYPQNNYLGFQMLATEQLAGKLRGTVQNAAEKVQTTLQQGMGFLSPQTCPSNKNYNNGKNEFQKPTFKSKDVYNPPMQSEYETQEELDAALKAYNNTYNNQVAVEKLAWSAENYCPGGLVATTPGSVVGGQITKALGANQDSTTLAGAMGNSISVILDTLLNHFLDKGLNALTSRSNPAPTDNWTYDGQELGSPAGANAAWDAGPDQEIILSVFKDQLNGYFIGTCKNMKDSSGIALPDIKDITETQCPTSSKGTWVQNPAGEDYIPGDIANTEKELQLINNEDPNDPGISQVFGAIWPKTMELDRCIPGPDINWQDRTEKELEKNSKLLQEQINEDNAERSIKADAVLKELQFAVNFFNDWINNKMMTELPHSVIFIDAVDEITTLHQQAGELTDARRLKTQALARLEAVKSGLETITVQPDPGSADEKVMIKLKQQYDATLETIATTASISNRQNELDVAKDKLANLEKLIPQCEKERTDKNWSNPGGWDSIKSENNNTVTEKALFCDAPIRGGYTHESFAGPDTTRPKLPMVNADNVLNWNTVWGQVSQYLCLGFCGGTRHITIDLSCKVIVQANTLDYKQNLPGAASDYSYEQLPADTITQSAPATGCDTCDEKGQSDLYQNEVRDAANEFLSLHPEIADLDSYDDSNGGVAKLRDGVIAILISKDFHAQTIGNYAQMVSVWKDNDLNTTDYRVTGGGGPISQAISAGYCGGHSTFSGQDIIPLSCTSSPTPSGQCAVTGGQYAGALRDAEGAVLAANSDVGDLLNIKEGGRPNARRFLKLVEAELILKGFNTTVDVLNGNNNLNSGDAIAIWKTGDTDPQVMERYDAIIGSAATIREAATAQLTGFIPLNCVAGQGGNDCGCKNTSPTNPITPAINPNNGTPFITSIVPATATSGATTITIKGSNFSTINKPANVATVRFYYGLNGRASVDGTVNSAKTQVTILVPAEINTTNTTIKIYRDEYTESNPYQIQISGNSTPGNTLGVPAATVSSVDATGGWEGSLAYNSINNNWLVVSGGVNGRIMGNDGKPVTSEFAINTDVAGLAPKVAFAPNLNKYLVVYIGFPTAVGGTIYGRFINANGTFSGNPFVIFKDSGGASYLYPNSILQYDSRNNKFVFVWEYRTPRIGVNLITINDSGTPGPVVDVAHDLVGGQWDPSLAINQNSNEYCVAYDERNDRKIAVKKINASTLAVGTETTLANVARDTGIVYNSVNNQYLLGWGDYAGTTKGRILKSCSITNVSGSTFTLNSAGETPSVSYNPKSNTYASIVQDQNDFGNTYNILNSSGTKLTSGIAFAGSRNGHGGNFSPVIAPNLYDGTFGAISSIDFAVTRFVAGLGIKSIDTIVSAPKYLDLGDGVFPDVVWYKSRLYVAYKSGNNLAINLYSFDKNLGDKKTEKIFTLSPGAGGFPRLTVSNNTLWVAYRDGEASGEDIKLWRQDTEATESLGPGIGNDPVALGYGYIAWQKLIGAQGVDSKVYRRALTGGTATFVRNWLPTGISRILSSGSVVMIDTDRTAVTWGLNAWFAGILTVATDVTPHDDNGVAVRFNNLASSEFNLWLGQRTHTPHAATDGLGNYAVATWNPTVRVAVFTGSGTTVTTSDISVTNLATVLPGVLVKSAYDSVNKVYLAVSGKDAWFLDKNGILIGSEFNIAPESPAGSTDTPVGWPNVAFGGGSFLVTYLVDTGARTKYGRLVQYRAGTTPSISERSKIVDITSAWYASERSQLVWDGTAFIVSSPVAGASTRQPQINHFNLNGTVSAGVNLGNGLDYEDPRGIACASNGTCLSVGWASNGGTYARRFNRSTLAPIGNLFYIQNDLSSRSDDQDLIYNTKTGKFLAVWAQAGKVFFRLINTDGTMGTLDASKAFASNVGDVKISYNAGTQTTLLVNKMVNEGLNAIELGDDGYPINTSKNILLANWDGLIKAWYPTISANQTDSEWLTLFTLSDGYHGAIVKK